MIGLKLFVGHRKIKLSFNNKKLSFFRKIKSYVIEIPKKNEILGWANMTPLGEIGNFFSKIFSTFLLSQITYFA